MGASEIIGLLGGIALFLFGMAIMGDGLKKVAGSKLELVLYKLTSTPLKGVLLGTGVTAVIQSSSATSVMVVGFVNSGMMKVNQAIGIVMGAILGTSVTGWILCLSSLSGGSGWVTLLSTATLTGLVAVVGIILRMAAKRPSTHHIGDILLGFAVLMYGMSIMSDAVSPLRDSQVFIDALTSFSNPLLGILVGLLFTSVIQSASAAVGILQALAVTGAITFEIALPIIMGIAIGAAVPVLLSALGANVSGKRTAFVYLLIDVLGVVIWATVFYIANAIAHFDFMTMTMTTVSIALMDNLLRAMELVHKFSDKGCRAVEDAENAIDRYEDRLGTYLMKITGKELSQRQSEEVSKYLHTISDFERISDHALNICDAAREINAKSVVFSPEAERELRTLEQAITEILHLAVGAFVSGDLEGASRVEPLEEIVDGLCDEMKLHHVDRLQKGVCTLNQGFIFNDLLTNYERVADHCSNIAVAMIELESDSFDTHEYLNSVKAMKSASFARYSAEYQKKYTL